MINETSGEDIEKDTKHLVRWLKILNLGLERGLHSVCSEDSLREKRRKRNSRTQDLIGKLGRHGLNERDCVIFFTHICLLKKKK